MVRGPKEILLILAVICFAIAVVVGAGIVTLDTKIQWVPLGLFFGFLSFLFW